MPCERLATVSRINFVLFVVFKLKCSHYYHMTLFNIRMSNSLSAIYVAKTKVLISCTASVFAYAKIRFSHDAAHFTFVFLILI